MATRAPPQSRNQTLYSSSNIWNNNNNNNSNHGNALHLQCLTVCSPSQAWFCFDSRVSSGSCRQSDKCYLHLLDEKLDSQRTNSSPYSTQMAYQDLSHQPCKAIHYMKARRYGACSTSSPFPPQKSVISERFSYLCIFISYFSDLFLCCFNVYLLRTQKRTSPDPRTVEHLDIVTTSQNLLQVG